MERHFFSQRPDHFSLLTARYFLNSPRPGTVSLTSHNPASYPHIPFYQGLFVGRLICTITPGSWGCSSMQGQTSHSVIHSQSESDRATRRGTSASGPAAQLCFEIPPCAKPPIGATSPREGQLSHRQSGDAQIIPLTL